MAHAPGTTPRLQRLSALAAIALVAIAVGFAFGRILVGPAATYRMLAVGLASGVIAWATERRGMVLATAASAAALLLALGWLAALPTTWYGIPTAETIRTLGSLATQVGAQAREYVSPAPATPALILAGTIAVWAAVFSCYALAFRAQSPLLSLVPPIALIVFADSVLDEVIRPLYGVLFLFAALAVLFADSLRRIRGWGPVWSPAGARDRLTPVAGRNARRVGVTAIAVAALAPAFVPGFGTTAVLDISRFGSDNRIRVSPLVSMGALLSDAQNGNNPEVFRVTADAPSYWRMVALDSFDGNTWEARPDVGVQLQGPTIQAAPTEGTEVQQTFTVSHDLGFGWLVGAAEPTGITINHDVWWHPLSSSLQMDGWPDEGETYSVTSVRQDVQPEQLRSVGATDVGAEDLVLPDDIPDDVRATAKLWTDGKVSDYAQVMAIIKHLRDGDFRYDLNVGYGGDSAALSEFLHAKKGFCQQFASLMAVMLRSLDIPARVALGFATGTPVGSDTWAVTLKQYHAWVEVPFHGYGWLSFDPTPRFNDPSAVWQPTPTQSASCEALGPQCGVSKGDQNHPGDHLRPSVKGGTLRVELNGDPGRRIPQTGGGPGPDSGGVPFATVLWIVSAALLALAIGIPLWHLLRRRRRLHAAHDPRGLILARYDVFGDRARELGWGRSPGETPEEFRRRLASNDALGDDAREPLGRLTMTVVEAAYGPDDPDRAALEEIERDTATVLQRLRATTPLVQRIRGLYRRD